MVYTLRFIVHLGESREMQEQGEQSEEQEQGEEEQGE